MVSRPGVARAPIVGVVSPLLRKDILGLSGVDLVEIGVDDLLTPESKITQDLALLIVGGRHDGALKTVLPVLRAAMPNLPMVALAGAIDQGDRNFFRNYVDGTYELPTDAIVLERLAVRGGPSAAAHWWGGWLRRTLWGLTTAGVLIGLWWTIVESFQPAPYLLPSPITVAGVFLEQPYVFLSHLGISAYEAALGFVAGNVLGILIAILLHRSAGLRRITLPILISLQAIPIVALAPLLVVWFGTGLLSKVAMAGLICFFPMVVNSLQAFADVDRDYVELFEFYRSGFLAKLRLLLMPASFPAIVSALKISAGLAVVGAIVAELTGADRGLGYLILNSSYRLETPTMFVAMTLSSVLGVAFFRMPDLLRFLVPRSWCGGLK